MTTKRYFVISSIVGGLIGSFLTTLWISPVTAQRHKFDIIQCHRLEIVDANGDAGGVLAIGQWGGRVLALGEDGRASAGLGIDGLGGRVDVVGKNGKSSASMGTNEYGGKFDVTGVDKNSQVGLGIDEHGGRVEVLGKGDGKVVMSINEYGNGAVSTYDNNGYLQ